MVFCVSLNSGDLYAIRINLNVFGRFAFYMKTLSVWQ